MRYVSGGLCELCYGWVFRVLYIRDQSRVNTSGCAVVFESETSQLSILSDLRQHRWKVVLLFSKAVPGFVLVTSLAFRVVSRVASKHSKWDLCLMPLSFSDAMLNLQRHFLPISTG